ncbi:MAG: PIN domain-containing protein [Deltaproteobacteria bacterium]|nr:PIN domain-containing protein [Deltaproteobacteria bacterium]
MGALIDTSVLVHVERGNLRVAAALAALEDSPVVSAITASELLHGVHRADAKRRDARAAYVERVLAGVPVIPFDLAAAREHARVWAEVKKAGISVGERDLMIAACALAHGHRVVTCDARSFGLVPGLTVETWTPTES